MVFFFLLFALETTITTRTWDGLLPLFIATDGRVYLRTVAITLFLCIVTDGAVSFGGVGVSGM